jgi:hypothetical protein
MQEFEFALDPSETLVIRRFLTPDRVPNKGKAVYRFKRWMTPWLEANGWKYVGHNQKDRTLYYFRSPGVVVAESFAIRVAIPNDDAILRATAAMLRFAQRAPGPTDQRGFGGRIGHYLTQFLMGRYFDILHAPYLPSGWKSWQGDEPPSLYVGMSGLWGTSLYWPDGLDRPPTWDRTEYFSAVVPGLTERGDLLSDLAAIHHAAELKRLSFSKDDFSNIH